MMNVFPFLHFFSFVAYCWLALYTLIKNPKALLNRLLVGLFLCFALWSFTFIPFHSPTTTADEARLLTNIGSLGWCSFSSIYLWFMLAYTGKTKILKSKWFYLLFLLPVILIYKQWDGFIFTDYVLHWYGWRGLYGKTIWTGLFFLYYSATMGIGLWLNLQFMKANQNPVARKRAGIFFITMLITMVLGSFSDVVFTLTRVYSVPNIADVAVLIWASGVVYAIEKYKFLTITPATATENIISTMFECLVLLDLEGNILSINRSSSQLLGYSLEQLKGQSIGSIIRPVPRNPVSHLKPKPVSGLTFNAVPRHPASPNTANALPGKALDPVKYIIKKHTIKNREFLFESRSGETTPVLFSSSRLKDQNGNDAAIVCLAKDITEQNKLKEEVLSSKKIESIGLLAAGIAQDFNQLLSVIIHDIARTREQLNESGIVDKLLASAMAASQDAAGLAEQLCSFAHNQAMDTERIFLSQLLTKPDTGFSLKGVSVEIEQSEEIWPVMANQEQLLHVLKNLLLNAKDAIQGIENGHIAITVDNIKIGSSKGWGFFLKRGDYIRLSVKDNGCGIAPEYIDNVFDPYFSTSLKSSRKGLGLGLTTCYAIMKRHKGHITIESEVGKGTCVSIYIPADPILKSAAPHLEP